MAARAFLLFIISAALLAQRYPIRIVDGSAAVQGATALAMDAKGAIWVATADQVLRFDGVRSIAVSDPASVLRGTFHVAATADGWVYTGSAQGLFAFHPSNGIAPRQLLGETVLSLATRGNTVYANGGGGDRLKGARFVAINLTAGTHRSAAIDLNTNFTFDGQGRLWFGCGIDACHIEAADLDAWPPRVQREPFHAPGGFMLSVVKDTQGCLWGRDNGATIRRCPGEATARLLAPELVSRHEGAQIGIDREGNVWLPGPFLSVFLKGAATPLIFTAANGVPPNSIRWLQGLDGTHWLAASTGLAAWPNFRRWEFWGPAEGMPDVGPITTLQLENGTRVVAAHGGLFRFDKERQSLTALAPRKIKPSVRALAATGRDRFLAAFFAGQVREYDAAGRLTLQEPNPGTVDSIMFLVPRRPGSWWAIGSAAVRVLDKTAGGLRIRPPAGIPSTGNGLDAELDGDTLYACTDAGLLIGNEGEWRIIDKSDGLLENSGRSIAVRNAGEIFYGYATREDFCRIRTRSGEKPKIDHFSEAGGFGVSRIHALDIDRKRGWLWRGSRDGLKAAPLDGVDSPDQWVHFGKFEGFGESVEIAQQGITFDEKDGSLWVGAGGELHHFFPDEKLFTESPDTSPFLASIQVNGGPWRFAPPAMPAFEEGSSVRFQLGSLYYSRRSSIEYRYRLDGLEQFSADGLVTLDKIAAGAHTLEFSARVRPSREWVEAGRAQFRASYPSHRNPYYYGGGAAFAALAAAGITLRRRQTHARFARQKKEFLNSLKGRRQSSDPAILRMLNSARDSFQPVFSAAPGQDLLAPGTILADRYQLGRLCGSGGFSNVYLAEDLQVRETVAVKIYTETPNRDKAWLAARMEQEMEALERLRHPHIVRFLNHGVTPGGASYLVMTFVPGLSLRAHLDSGGPFPNTRVLRIVDQLASALDALHAAGIVHRDLKPENVLLSGEGQEERATLIDFSIAIVKDPRATQYSLTRAAGSWPYMAPEQLIGYGAPGTDIYALALVIFELLTAKQASQLGLGATTGNLGVDLVSKLVELRPDLAPLGRSPLGSAVSLELLNRPQIAGVFALAVRQWLSDTVTQPGA